MCSNEVVEDRCFGVTWEEDRVCLHLNDAGIDYFIDLLNRLKRVEEQEHYHLMTPDWGDEELTTPEVTSETGELEVVNHLCVMKW
jgi:hypothetical protein